MRGARAKLIRKSSESKRESRAKKHAWTHGESKSPDLMHRRTLKPFPTKGEQ